MSPQDLSKRAVADMATISTIKANKDRTFTVTIDNTVATCKQKDLQRTLASLSLPTLLSIMYIHITKDTYTKKLSFSAHSPLSAVTYAVKDKIQDIYVGSNLLYEAYDMDLTSYSEVQVKIDNTLYTLPMIYAEISTEPIKEIEDDPNVGDEPT